MRRTKSFRLSKRHLVAAALLAAKTPLSHAGLMDPSIDLQTYRDFAENRGEFAAGATNVPVYDVNGSLVGTIDRVMNFDSTVDGGWSSLAGGASFLATVAHNSARDLTFTTRFGATSGTPFYDSYHVVAYNRASDTPGGGDYAIPRLNKIVTDAVAVPYLTDSSILNNMTGRVLQRVGGGVQDYAGVNSITNVGGGYEYLTGGTFKVTSESIAQPTGSGVTNPLAYTRYEIDSNFARPTADSPLSIGGRPGDSGSPSWYYNTNTGRWEYVSALDGSWGGKGFTQNTFYNFGNAWAVAMINAYNSPTITPTAGGGNITWNAPGANGTGTFTQGATSWNYVGLASNIRGATSTLAADGVSTTAATDAQMDATRNLVFAGSGGTIVLGGSVDMGAGSLTFQNNYTLSDGGVTSRRLNSAGFIIGGGYTVTSNLTGISGDEWRVVSDSINGNTTGIANFTVGGSGNNNADLNFGGNLLVQLNRTGGYAANDVKINGGAVTVRLLQANQISGDVIFGHRGGTLDLYGQNWTTDHITHLDDGAVFANRKANTTSTFTYTGSGSQSYLGGFSDGGSAANGLLNVNYNPGTPAGAVWNLSGDITNKGTWTVSAGKIALAGTPTLHAGGYVDPNDWQRATFNTGTVNVANGANFSVGQYADFTASSVSVANGGTFAISGGNNTFSAAGGIALNGTTAALNITTVAGQSLTAGSAITGTGSMTTAGTGTLTLSNTGNTFSGTKTHNGGTLLGTSLAALGDTTTNKWNLASASSVIGTTGATAAQVKVKLTTGSVGTLALAGTNPDAAPDMTGYSGLYLGAIGSQTVDTPGITNLLTPWVGSNTGWNLGGGGGTLTMGLKLSGSGTLTIGNGYTTGTVVLANSHNADTWAGAAFTGMINVNPGVALQYTDINALGTLSGSDRIAVAYGARLVLGTGANATTVFNAVTTGSAGVLSITGTDTNAYSFSGQGLNSAALGANGTATYSGTITTGTGGYKFGGDGALTVTSVLFGANALSADGQGTTGGVTTLTGNNTFTGAVTVQGGTANGILGSHTLKLGSNTAIGSGNAVTINDGGALDLNGKTVSIGTLTGTAASTLTNSSATAVTVTINESAPTTMGGTISGALALVKTGAGTLTLSGTSTYSGGTTVNAGTLQVSANANLGASSGSLTLNGGTLATTAGFTLNSSRGVSLGASGGTFDSTAIGTSSTFAIAGVISGTGPLTFKSNGDMSATGGGVPGRLDLTGTNTFTGDTTILSGLVGYSSDSAFGAAGNKIILNGGGLLDAGRSVALSRNIVVQSGGGTFRSYSSVNTTWSGSITGSGNINRTDGGTLNLAGDLSGYSGTFNNQGGTTNLTGTASMIGGNWTTSSGTLGVNSSTNQTMTGMLAGSGAFMKSGTGTLSLTGANTLTGTTTVNSGTVKLANSLALGNSTLSLSGGAVSFDSAVTSHAFTLGGLSGSGALALNDTASNAVALTVGNNNASTTHSGVISGTGSLVKSGTGTLTLSGANTYTGGTAVSAGALTLGNTSALGTGTLTITSTGNAVLSAAPLTGAVTISNAIALNNTGTTGFYMAGGSGNNVTFAGNITGTTSMLRLDNNVADGSGTFTLSGNNTFTTTSKIYVNRGSLRIGSETALGASTNTLHYDSYSGTLSFAGSYSIANNINFTFASQKLDTEANTVTLSGVVGGNQNLTKIGLGTLTFSGANTYTGGTTISAGTLQIGNGGTSGNLGTGAVTDNAAIVFNRSNAITVANAISGTGTLSQIGTGTTTLTGSNTYTGGTTVTAGTLALGNASALGAATNTLAVNGGALNLGTYTVTTGALTLAGGAIQNGTLTATSYATSSGTVSANLAGTGALTQSGGTTILSGNNTYTGGTTVNSGTLALGSGTALANSGAVTVNGGALDLGGWTETVGAVSLNGGTIQNGTLTGASYATNSGTVSAVLAGSGALTQSGGTTTLSGNNTYTGGTTVNSGTLVAANTNALGSGTVAVNSATLDLNGGSVTTGAISLNGGTIQNGTLTGASYATRSGTVSAVLAGTGTLTQNGAGTTTLSGDNTYSGGTTISGGTVRVADNNSALGTGTVAFTDDATLATASGGGARNLANSVTVSSGTTASLDGGYATITLSGNISGAGNIAKTSVGTVVLTGNNTYSGTTSIAATSGGIQVGNGGASGTLGSGSVSIGSGGSLTYNRSDSVTIANTIAGTGDLTFTGTGVSGQSAYKLTGDNSGLSGAVTATNSRAQADNASGNRLGTGALTTGTGGQFFITGGTVANTMTLSGNGWQEAAGVLGALRLAGGATVSGAVTLAGDTRITAYNGNGVISGIIGETGGARALEIGGAGQLAGTVTLAGANTYSGGTTVSAGTLALGNASALGASTNTLAVNNGTLDLGAYSVTAGAVSLNGGTIQNGTLTGSSYTTSSGSVSAVLAGTGALTQNGAGTTTLSGNNTYTGGTTVNSGTLALGNASALGATTNTLAVNNGTLDLGAYSVTTGAVSLNGGTIQNGTLTGSSYATSYGTVSAILAGTGALTQNGAGTTTLSGNNTYTGGTTVNSGTLALGSGTALANAGAVTVNGGAFDLGGFSETVDVVTLNGGTIQNGTLTGSSYTTSSGTVTASLAGSGTLTQSGSGTTLLSGANSYSGRTTVNSGTLVITGTNSSSGATTVNAGTLALDAGSALASGTLSLNNGSRLTSSGTQDIVITNAILLQSGATNTFNFGDTTNTGEVKLTSGFSLGGYEKKISVASGASAEFSGVISAANVSGRITKIGLGTLTLSGANITNGTTTVNGGTLVAGHNSAFGIGAVTVNNTGTLNSGIGRTLANTFTINTGGALGGAATFTGTVTVNSGATLTPGSTGSIGKQTFGNGVTLAAGASYLWEITGIAPATADVDFDQIAVNAGTMAIANSTTLKVSALGVDYTNSFWDSSHTFTIATKTGTGTITGAFASLDTSLAGAYSAEGAWSLLTAGNGDLQALWNPSMGMSMMSFTAVPEPREYGLMGAATIGLAATLRRRRKKTAMSGN